MYCTLLDAAQRVQHTVVAALTPNAERQLIMSGSSSSSPIPQSSSFPETKIGVLHERFTETTKTFQEKMHHLTEKILAIGSDSGADTEPKSS